MIKILIALVVTFNLFAEEPPSSDKRMFKVFKQDEFALKDEKNGIHLENISKNFEKNFKFVSVHYREDKFEIRFIYGNKLAMEGLKSKDFKYKDGAILYKVVYKTEHDPSFNASLVPEARPAVRQIMLKDSKRFKNTNGWGYAVFTDEGKTLPGDPDATLATCFACHQLAAARGDVFSWPMESLLPNAKAESIKHDAEAVGNSKKLTEKLFNFSTGNFSDLDKEIQNLLLQKTQKVNILTGDMIKSEFPGYMTELNSFLIEQTRKTGLPSVVFKKFNDRLIFSYSYIDYSNTECKAGENKIKFGVGSKDKQANKNFTNYLEKCFRLKIK
jgi:hypothetical protein